MSLRLHPIKLFEVLRPHNFVKVFKECLNKLLNFFNTNKTDFSWFVFYVHVSLSALEKTVCQNHKKKPNKSLYF